MTDGATFCTACGQAFSTAAAMISRPMNAQVAATARVEYGGFWLRFLAYLIDGAVIIIGICVVAVPLVFLTGVGAYLSQINPEEDWNENGAWVIIPVIFLLATASLAVTWLYHALMESSEWQATVGKKVLGLVVTDMEGRRVSFWRATGRHFAKIVTNMVPAFIGYILAGFTEKKQALHDMIAGCLILQRGN